jgi:predicted CxxxxCH...CXXCH cytochrome family protein
MKNEFPNLFPEKCSNIKCHENSSSGSGVVPREGMDGRTDVTK